MFAPGDSVVVGVSGGADSVALLHVLTKLRVMLSLGDIIPAHVNHNLRGKESDGDEAFVKGLCDNLKLPLVTYQANVKALADEKNLGIEAAGRLLRYSFFEKVRASSGAQKIAVGHNRDDVAETVMMNLCRGSGLKGLCGIPPVNGVITRPLINAPRDLIEKYLNIVKISYVTDASNYSDEYTRNRIRNKLMPVLASCTANNVSEIIARNASWLSADEEFIESAAQAAYETCVLPSDAILLDAIKLSELPEALSRRVVRHAIAKARGNDYTDISAVHVQAAICLAQGHSGRETHLPGVVVKKEYDSLVFAPRSPAIATLGQGFCYSLEVGGSVYVPELRKTLTISCAAPEKSRLGGKKPILYCTKAFEYGNVKEVSFTLRTRRPGDRIAIGANMTKKLQDYFTDTKIPASQRDSIPLLAVGSDILWILHDDRVSAKYKPVTTCETNRETAGQLIWVSLWEDFYE